MADENITFSLLPDDVVLKLFFLLEDDPRNWACLSCVCRKFSSLISTVCCKTKCLATLPSLSAELLSLSSPSSPPCGWSAVHKLAVCCPGLHHAGVLLDNSDFGLLRELGPDSNFDLTPPESRILKLDSISASPSSTPIQNNDDQDNVVGWSLYDDLYYDTIYDNSESCHMGLAPADAAAATSPARARSILDSKSVPTEGRNKKRKMTKRPHRPHLASKVWSLNREQGNKLLASRFRGDCLYICDWPGCEHMEEKRNYMLFRGFFKNFSRSRVWRTINDGNRSSIDLKCGFCNCNETWDLHSAFCLRRGFGFHDDGEPVVRAYVCKNGHVSGAWTDQPLYT